ncbi:nucleotidyltransferase family protein [Piscinibacter sp. XHJ-5]|uniref:nucleotidyltransferase family protein n=1 Tax=Piscinibacter sp. XHJ-5 TaxID=3037797 RepID=UPI002453049B|nr:nucleotidyltransferase family protein [Piscinibacter sp. XHJ-5]
MKSRPAVIVLAAGTGSRFGASGHKLTQRLGASSVLGSTLRHAIASHLPVIVVTTEALADAARHHVASRDVVVVPEVGTPGPHSLGMGYSIAAGVSARPQASGWLVLPGDMPMIQPATLLAVAAALEHHPVTYAQHRGRRGHPVGFAAELYSELVTLSGDEGAKRLVARYPAHGVDVDDAGVLLDVDTEADLEKLRLAHATQPPYAAPVAR